ncbi:MAG: lysophospholipid acyltransferase family protein [Lautropia sp.]|nr:lysophospholipid acyltransferase family protein [Lautropia sp.]
MSSSSTSCPTPENHTPAGRQSSLPGTVAAHGLMGIARLLTGVRSLWTGCAPVPRQRVYFANHSSHTDFLLLWTSLPAELRRITRPVAGADYWQASALRRFIIHDVFNGVLVDRSGPRAGTLAASAPAQPPTQAPPPPHDLQQQGQTHQPEHAAAAVPGEARPDAPSAPRPTEPPAATALSADAPLHASRSTTAALQASTALQPLIDALKQGDSLIIFPEGTRNTEDGLLPFKSGIYHLAKAFPQVEFVPVWLENLNRVMPKGQIIPLPILCSVTFGEPIALRPDESKDAWLDRARQALLKLNPHPEN